MGFTYRAARYLAAAVLLVLGCGSGDPGPYQKIATKQLRADFRQLRTLIENDHPLSFTDRAYLDSVMDAQYDSITRSMTVLEFYRIVAPAVAAVDCSHTRIWHSDKVEQFLEADTSLLPLDLRTLGDTLVVNYCLIADSIPRGARVLSIDGTHSDKLIHTMLSMLPADHMSDTHRQWLLNQDFMHLYQLLVGRKSSFESYSGPTRMRSARSARRLWMSDPGGRPSGNRGRRRSTRRWSNHGLLPTAAMPSLPCVFSPTKVLSRSRNESIPFSLMSNLQESEPWLLICATTTVATPTPPPGCCAI